MPQEYKWLYDAILWYGTAAILASWFIKIVIVNIFDDWPGVFTKTDKKDKE